MELEIVYIHNGQKGTYYVTIEFVPNLLPKDIESSIMYQLKRHIEFCPTTDSLTIESISRKD